MIDREELHRQFEKDCADAKLTIERLMKEEHIDEDDYPTEAAIDIVKLWHWSDARGWFEFIKSIWWMASWGWREQESIDEVSGEKAYCYYVSTGGWSGNEAIIRAMQENDMMWHMNWVQSRRGGHYIFELKEFDDE